MVVPLGVNAPQWVEVLVDVSETFAVVVVAMVTVAVVAVAVVGVGMATVAEQL